MGDTPYYLAIGDEVEVFSAAYACRLPILLKGPTGCGKTRFVEYMAYRLRRPLSVIPMMFTKKWRLSSGFGVSNST